MEHPSSLFTLSIDPIGKEELNDAVRWARFLAIAGMTVLFLLLIITLLSSVIFYRTLGVRVWTINGQSDDLTTGLRFGWAAAMIIMTLIAFFPLLYLLRFANKMKHALAGNDQQNLNLSFRNLKRYFRYLGLLFIIIFSIYMLAAIFTLIGSFSH